METRVKKYKEYRDEIMAEADVSLDSAIDYPNKKHMRDTSTILPMDQVIEKLVIDESEVKRQKKIKRNIVLRNLFFGAIIALIIIALVVVGIIVF